MIRILIAEDEKAISDLIKLSLQKNGYQCVCCYDGASALDALLNDNFDLALLDVMMPQMDGFEIMDYIRPLKIPVIFITAKNSVEDRVKGLKMGAEDYIVKPFEIIELLARIEVALRRFDKLDRYIRIHNLTIDTDARCVMRDDVKIPLTNKEYELLLIFAKNPGCVLYRELLYERVWGGDYPSESRTVDLHVQRMRKKVGLEDKLVAVPKIGYRLEA